MWRLSCFIGTCATKMWPNRGNLTSKTKFWRVELPELPTRIQIFLTPRTLKLRPFRSLPIRVRRKLGPGKTTPSRAKSLTPSSQKWTARLTMLSDPLRGRRTTGIAKSLEIPSSKTRAGSGFKVQVQAPPVSLAKPSKTMDSQARTKLSRLKRRRMTSGLCTK